MAKLSSCDNVLMEDRNGLIVDLRIEQAVNGYAERNGALATLDDMCPIQERRRSALT